MLDRAKRFVAKHFEKLLVLLLAVSLVLIHAFVDQKIAFLNFYFLPVILAGFYLGRRGAVFSAVLIIAMVIFLQAVVGLESDAGFEGQAAVRIATWAGFLILTGYVVGRLAGQRTTRLAELTDAYITMLEILTFHLESTERHIRGHSFRVAARSVAIARALGLDSDEIEQIRVAALLHELSPADPRLLRLFEHFPGSPKQLPIATSMRAALDIVREYSGYYEHVSPEWPIDHLRVSLATKIVAVADAFETLQVRTDNREPFTPWAAMEEIERGKGVTFATPAVDALRHAITPDRVNDVPILAQV